jgi:hypothetical protein
MPACRSAASNVPTRGETTEGPRLCRHCSSREEAFAFRGSGPSPVMRALLLMGAPDARLLVSMSTCPEGLDALLVLEVLPVLAVSFGWPMWR